MSGTGQRYASWREGRAMDVTRAVSRVLRRVGGIGLSIDEMIRDAKAARSSLWEWEATAALAELRGIGLVDRSRAAHGGGKRPRGTDPDRVVPVPADRVVRWYWRLDVPTPGSWRTSLEDLCRDVDRILDEVRRWDGGRWVGVNEVCRVLGGRSGGGVGIEDRPIIEDRLRADTLDAARIVHGLDRLYDAGLVETHETGSVLMFRLTR